MQILDVGGEMLFESKRHDLRELGAALHREHRLGQQSIGGRGGDGELCARGRRPGPAANAAWPGTGTMTWGPVAAAGARSSGPDATLPRRAPVPSMTIHSA